MFCRWRSSYIEDGWDPIYVCLYMFCHGRSSYIEGKVRIPLTFVYICFAVGIQLYRRDCWDPINVCLYFFPVGDPVIQKMVGIPLMFVYICFAFGDPAIQKGLLGSHQRLFIYVFPLEIQLYRGDGWDPINVCLYMFSHWRSSYIEGKVGIPLTFVYICFSIGDPVIQKGLLGSH